MLVIGILIFITVGLLSKGNDDNVNRMEDYRGKKYDDVKNELIQKGFKITETGRIMTQLKKA